MKNVRSVLAPVFALLAVACRTTTECDCIAPTAVVFGTVSGTLAPVGLEVRMAPGDCNSGPVPAGTASQGRSDARGDYEVVVYLNQPGPTCLFVTAVTLDLPLASVTKRVAVTLETFDAMSPQRIRVDLALGATQVRSSANRLPNQSAATSHVPFEAR
jgi:hypothetical protein